LIKQSIEMVLSLSAR